MNSEDPPSLEPRLKWYEAAMEFVSDKLTGYRIFRVPILNWGIISVYVYLLIRLTIRFRALYAKHALFTTLITNCILFGTADTLAQTLASVQGFQPDVPGSNVFIRYIIEKGRPSRIMLLDEDDEEDNLEELGIDNTAVYREQPSTPYPTKTAIKAERFSFRRLALFMLWGLIISFFQAPWYAILNSLYSEDNLFLSTLKRVMADQLCYSPLSLAAFFSYMATVMENGGRDEIVTKLRTKYLPTLVVNYSVWPAVQFVNFMFMPKSAQIPFASTVSVFWNCYLSLKNAGDEKN